MAQQVGSDDLEGWDNFGSSVAMDNEVAIIGVPSLEQIEQMGRPGKAYIYRKIDSFWQEEALLAANMPIPNEMFGFSVSIDDDIAVIGAPSESYQNDGVIYVFKKSDVGWIQHSRLAIDLGGVSIGYDVLINEERILAPDTAGNRVFVYENTDDIWQIEHILTPSIPNIYFGSSVAIHDNIIAVGSRDTSPHLDRRGRVFIFKHTQAGWIEETILTTPEGTPVGDAFGWAITFAGDKLVVGSPEPGLPYQWGTGNVYIFEQTDGIWRIDAQIEAEDAVINSRFGRSVAADASTIVVGAQFAGNNSSGGAYVFYRTVNGWEQEYKLAPRGNPVGLGYGAVAYSDGIVLLGARTDDVGAEDTGSAFFFDLEDYDLDRVQNGNDNCPLVPNIEQTNLDGDTTGDVCDDCPEDALKSSPGACGCGVPDTDANGNGIIDCEEPCPDISDCDCGVVELDTDDDGISDCADGCPMDPGKSEPGVCGCGVIDEDTDADGSADCVDECPEDRAKIQPLQCGCGVSEEDIDRDGIANCNDLCPLDPQKSVPGTCGCGVVDLDTDMDGVFDCDDRCPEDPEKVVLGLCGCGIPDTDTDTDETPDCIDICAEDANKIEPGLCGCGQSDIDSDLDDIVDCFDGCPEDAEKVEPGQCGCGTADIDSDGDGVPNCHDACAENPNEFEPGECGCGIPDTDSDDDGIPDCHDGCANDHTKIDPGICGCNIPDTDSDSDGTAECSDECPNDAAQVESGECGCGIPDTDSDDDGIPDCHDGCANDHTKIDPGICGCNIPDTDSDSDGTADCNDGCPNDVDKTVAQRCGCGASEGDCEQPRPGIDMGPDVDDNDRDGGCSVQRSPGRPSVLLLALLLLCLRQKKGGRE